jgi:uncharacterized protein (UPF0332 family)
VARYEIQLPLKFNDGIPIPEELFLQVKDELIARFGGFRVLSPGSPAEGYWRSPKGIVYQDQSQAWIVTTSTTPLRQAEETLRDAEKILQNNLSPRSILNRTYYVMFYAVLALFIDKNINLKTSKHAGIISIFDREFVHTEKIDKEYSKILHTSFNLRQEGDYRELVELSAGDAAQSFEDARTFLDVIKASVKGGK